MTRPRIGSLALVAILILGQANPVLALGNPTDYQGMLPADGTPGPEQPMRQSSLCASAVSTAYPDVSRPAPAWAMLDVDTAWRYSTGSGVTVAVIDTGVTPNPRLHVRPGGDYVAGGDGLSDCDAHGTVIASVIAAAPQGVPSPPPMPGRTSPPPSLSLSPSPAPDPPRSTRPAPTAPGQPDGVVGVAPDAILIAIRQSSRAFTPVNPGPGDRTRAHSISTLARALVHAANLGAGVINVAASECFPAAEPVDQRNLGAAVRYAATVKDAVIVAAAGTDGQDGCVQNPTGDPSDAGDVRHWRHITTVSSPSWFADDVLSVGAVDLAGTPMGKSLAGPWIGVAAPGVSITGLSPQGGTAVNAYPPGRPGEQAIPFWGSGFASAYVSGVAALVRARFPNLTAQQVIHRIRQTAHNPARGVDNRVGHGVIDPVAALTFDVAERVVDPVEPQSRPIAQTAPPPASDRRAHDAAAVFAAALAGIGLAAAAIVRIRRPR